MWGPEVFMSFFTPKAKSRALGTAAFALALAATSASAAFAEGKTVRAVMHAGMRILDPIANTAHITRNHGYMVYDTLTALDAEGVAQPQMAEWTISEDKLTYVFTLRDGLKFHDGSDVTAEDVVPSLKRWGSRDGAGKFLMAATADIVATDAKTVTWTLKEEFPLLLQILSKPSSVPAFIMPARLAATPGTEQITEVIGSGPYKFVAEEFQPGVSTVYVKNEDYLPRSEPASGMAGGKVVNVDRVEWITMPDTQTAINALMTGEVQWLESVQVDLLPILEGNPDIVTEVRDREGFQALARPNFKNAPFDNQKIRQAAMMALDQEAILATMVGNPDYYSVCGAIFGCEAPLGSEVGAEVLKKGGDKEAAKALLAEAGYDGTPIVVMQATDNVMAPMPVVIAQNLRDAGFNVDLQPMDWQTLVSRRANMGPPSEGGWHLFATFGTGVEINTPLYHPAIPSTGDTGFFGWADDPEMERLRASYLKAATFEEQKAVAEAVQKQAMDFVTIMPLGAYQWVQGRDAKLVNILPTAVPVFWNLKLND